MSTLGSRLSRLETAMVGRGPGRQVVVRSRGATDADIDAHLAGLGIVLDDRRDMLVVFNTVYERRDGAEDIVPPQVELLHVHELKH